MPSHEWPHYTERARSPEHQELQDLNWSARPSPCCHDNVFLIFSDTLGTNFAQIFCIFSSSRIIVCTVPTQISNCALIVSIDTRWSLSMKFFIWPINSGVLTSLFLPHLSSSHTDTPPSLNLLCHSKIDARFMQDAPKASSHILNSHLWGASKFRQVVMVAPAS